MDKGCDWYHTYYKKIASTRFIRYRFAFTCFHFYASTCTIEIHTKNSLIVLVWNCSPKHNMMLPYFLFVSSAFSLFQLGHLVMCKPGHLSSDSIVDGKIGLCLCPIQVTCYTCSLLTKSLTVNK